MSEIVEFTVPIKLTNDNEGQSRHFSKAHKRRDDYQRTLSLLGYKRKHPPLYKQRITITRILGKGERLWDADSVLRGSAKQLIDSLVSLRFMFDDGPRWLVDAHGKQDESDRASGGGVRILLERVN